MLFFYCFVKRIPNRCTLVGQLVMIIHSFKLLFSCVEFLFFTDHSIKWRRECERKRKIQLRWMRVFQGRMHPQSGSWL